jgi:G3E family GTPase
MIPITVVTGFLGSGKTSLIAHLLDSYTDGTIGVVVNDLANESIDAAFLRGGEHIDQESGWPIAVVAGGRAAVGRLEETINAVTELLEHEPPPEAIVVETSGSSPARALVEALQTDKRIVDRAVVDSVLAMIDTTSIATYWRDPQLQPLVRDQLAAADMIVLNKFDRAGFWSRRASKRIARSVNPVAALGSAEYGRLPTNEIVGTNRRAARMSAETVGSVRRPHPSAASFSPLVARHLEEALPFHPERLDQWLNDEWPGIVRVKGFVWLASDMEHVYVLDVAPGQREVGMEGTWYGALSESDRPQSEAVRRALQRGPWQDRHQSLTLIGAPDAVEREIRNIRRCMLSRPEIDRGPRAWRSLPDPIRLQFDAAERESAAHEGAELTP